MTGKSKDEKMGQKISFEQWKKDAIEYLHSKCPPSQNYAWDWILGDDEDMRRDGYDDDQTPAEYVDYQLECAA